MLKSIKVLTAVFMMAGLAHAEGGDGLEDPPIAYLPDELSVIAQPLSCQEARATAWFVREMERSDGYVETSAQYGECPGDREILADSTGDGN